MARRGGVPEHSSDSAQHCRTAAELKEETVSSRSGQQDFGIEKLETTASVFEPR